MKQTKREKIPVFTVTDHLKVQMQIEQRAHELWLSEGAHENTALDNWLNAEREVLEEFFQAHKNGPSDERHQKRVGRRTPRSCVERCSKDHMMPEAKTHPNCHRPGRRGKARMQKRLEEARKNPPPPL